MPESRLLARVHDRSGALERLVGLLRRRAVAVRRLSVAHTDDGVLEVLIRIDDERSPADRVQRELSALHDLVDVRTLAGDGARPTRELLLAWIHPDAAAHAAGPARIVAIAEEECLLEMTGTSDEIDAWLTRLGRHGTIYSSVRSGELAAPARPTPERSDA